MPDDGRPARMDTGDLVILRPESDDVLEVTRREGCVECRIGGDDRIFLGHGPIRWAIAGRKSSAFPLA